MAKSHCSHSFPFHLPSLIKKWTTWHNVIGCHFVFSYALTLGFSVHRDGVKWPNCLAFGPSSSLFCCCCCCCCGLLTWGVAWCEVFCTEAREVQYFATRTLKLMVTYSFSRVFLALFYSIVCTHNYNVGMIYMFEQLMYTREALPGGEPLPRKLTRSPGETYISSRIRLLFLYFCFKYSSSRIRLLF